MFSLFLTLAITTCGRGKVSRLGHSSLTDPGVSIVSAQEDVEALGQEDRMTLSPRDDSAACRPQSAAAVGRESPAAREGKQT